MKSSSDPLLSNGFGTSSGY